MIYLLYYFIYMQLQFEIFFLLFVSFSNVFDFLLFSEIVFHFNLCAEFAFNSIHLYKWRQNLCSNFIFVVTRYLKVKQIIYELIGFILLSLHYYCLIQWQKDWRSFEFVIWFIFFFSLASSVMFVYWHSRFVRSLKSEWNRYTCNVCILQVLGKINNYTPFSTWILEFFCDLLKFGHSIFVSISEIVNN